MRHMMHPLFVLGAAVPAAAQSAEPFRDISAEVVATTSSQEASGIRIELAGHGGWTCSGTAAKHIDGVTPDTALGGGGQGHGRSRSRSSTQAERSGPSLVAFRLVCSHGRTGTASLKENAADGKLRVSFRLSDRTKGAADLQAQ